MYVSFKIRGFVSRSWVVSVVRAMMVMRLVVSLINRVEPQLSIDPACAQVAKPTSGKRSSAQASMPAAPASQLTCITPRLRQSGQASKGSAAKNLYGSPFAGSRRVEALARRSVCNLIVSYRFHDKRPVRVDDGDHGDWHELG